MSIYEIALANHLWQSTVFLLAVWLIALFLSNAPARIRFRLWMAASLKLLIPCSLLISLGSLFPGKTATVPVAQTPLYAGVYSTGSAVGEPFAEVQPVRAGRVVKHGNVTSYRGLALTIWLAGSMCAALVWFLRWRRVAGVKARAILLRAAVRRRFCTQSMGKRQYRCFCQRSRWSRASWASSGR